MTDNITLPRAVVEQVREALKELDYASEPYVNEIARTALAALDDALAEPEPTVKDSLTVDRIRSIWLDSWKACGNVPTPVLAEHFARQIERAHGIGLAKPTGKDSFQVDAALAEPPAKPEPATYEQVYEAYGVDGMDNWLDYRVGWLAAERFHGITEEDK
jgi:hypothetical protein